MDTEGIQRKRTPIQRTAQVATRIGRPRRSTAGPPAAARNASALRQPVARSCGGERRQRDPPAARETATIVSRGPAPEPAGRTRRSRRRAERDRLGQVRDEQAAARTRQAGPARPGGAQHGDLRRLAEAAGKNRVEEGADRAGRVDGAEPDGGRRRRRQASARSGWTTARRRPGAGSLSRSQAAASGPPSRTRRSRRPAVRRARPPAEGGTARSRNERCAPGTRDGRYLRMRGGRPASSCPSAGIACDSPPPRGGL